MTIQVLVAAMNQVDHSLPEKMNIHSDAIVGNQCDQNSIEEYEWEGHTIKYLNFAERGVGLNRNNALMRATGDICLFADDDMVYVDEYVDIVCKAFEKYPDADVIAFNLREKEPTRYIIEHDEKVGFFNYLRYGTARVAVRLKSILREGIAFHLCFGGGTEHSHGEDNIFLTDCLKKGLKIYAVPEYIAVLTEERKSTWNNGYNERYLKDQGALYRAISRKWWRLLCLQDAIRHHSKYRLHIVASYKLMINGGVRGVNSGYDDI